MSAKMGKVDPNKFEGEGLNFRAKLIGVDDVAEARGDKMCQMSMQKLKASVKAAGEHKQRIVVNVSLEGLKIIDGISMAIQYTHAVHRISFIARDVSDSRAFGYIFGVGDGTHKFFAIKTEKQAEQLVLTLRDLFQAVYDMKKQEVEDAKKKQEEDQQQQQQQQQQPPQPETPATGGEQKPTEATQDAPEAVYQVPQNNAPVAGEEKKSGSNLLDLEDQLENIELGIQQMSSFDMFDTNTPDTSKSTTDPWGTSTPQADIKRNASGSNLDDLAGLQSGFGAQSAFPATSGGFGATTANPFSAPTSQPFGGQPFGQQTSQPFGQPATSQPFGQPATSQPFGQPATSQPFGQPATSQPFGQPATSQPFGQPATSQPFAAGPGSMPPGAAFGMPGTPMPGAQPQVRPGFGQPGAGGFGQPAVRGFGQTAPAGFGQQPFGGAVGQPVAGGFGQPAAFMGAFGAAQPAMGQPQQNLFPDTEPDPNILTPTVLNEPETEEVPTEPQKKDAFADLVNIGGSDPKKTPKAIFESLNTPPKKSLNELKVDVNPPRTPSPGTPSPGVISPGMQQASDPFGPLGKEAVRLRGLADSSKDPFDTSYVHIPQPTSQPSSSPPAQDADPFLPAMTLTSRLSCENTPKKQTPADVSKHEHLPKKSPKRLTNGNIPVFSDDFNLPSPEEPPPPLPAEVKLSLPGGAPPPPPPRPKANTNSASVRPRPVPKPRKNTSTSSSLSSTTDPFFPSSSTDPFSDSFPSAPSTQPNQKSKDPFFSSQPSFESTPFENWDPFSDFSSDIFKDNCFTVFDSSSEKNGPTSVSEQHK
ncbi:disabled homolog 1-like isoform X2 [Haliotis asinina]|uniref:disabled homolog 1-like isoform X2 n=1 Tax=Haliotis asinina TaxID=109174 RepID=UPI00353272CE